MQVQAAGQHCAAIFHRNSSDYQYLMHAACFELRLNQVNIHGCMYSYDNNISYVICFFNFY